MSEMGPLESMESHGCWHSQPRVLAEQGRERPGMTGESGFLFWHSKARESGSATGLGFLDSQALTHGCRDAKPATSLPAGLALALPALHTGAWGPSAPVPHSPPARFPSSAAPGKGGRSRGKGAGKGQEVSSLCRLCGHGPCVPLSLPSLFPHPSRAVSRRHAPQTLAVTRSCTNHRITESLRLENTSNIIKSNHQPITITPAKSYLEVPYLHVF